MPWVSKRELELRDKQMEQLERLLEIERERADRLHDQLLLLHGHEPVTPVVRTERAAQQNKQNDEMAERQRQMNEIFSEAMGEHSDVMTHRLDIQNDIESMLRR